MRCPNCGREGAVALSGNANSLIEGYCNLCGEDFSLPFWWAIGKGYNGTKGKKEKYNMQVTYNGFTGELVKLEKKETGRYTLSPFDTEKHPVFGYNLSLYDSEKQATISFTGVKMEDLQFHGGAVKFGG